MSVERPRLVLLVEDEQTQRVVMMRGLAKLPGVVVKGVGTLREARQVLADAPPDLVVADLDLPDGTGIEMLTELDRLGLRRPIIFVSAYLGKFRDQLPRRGDVDVYEKPLALETLRSLVEGKLELTGGDQASPFGVVDYVQLAGMGRHSVVVEVRTGSGGGQVTIKGGEVWSANDEQGAGIEAFRRLVSTAGARVSCRTLRQHELSPIRAIEGSTERILLDAAVAADERARQASRAPAAQPDELDDAWVQPPAPPATPAEWRPKATASGRGSVPWLPPVPPVPPVVAANRPAARPHPPTAPPAGPPVEPPAPPSAPVAADARTRHVFDDLVERGVDALLAKDYHRAYAAFVEADQVLPGDRRVLANIQRLRALGIG